MNNELAIDKVPFQRHTILAKSLLFFWTFFVFMFFYFFFASKQRTNRWIFVDSLSWTWEQVGHSPNTYQTCNWSVLLEVLIKIEPFRQSITIFSFSEKFQWTKLCPYLHPTFQISNSHNKRYVIEMMLTQKKWKESFMPFSNGDIFKKYIRIVILFWAKIFSNWHNISNALSLIT